MSYGSVILQKNSGTFAQINQGNPDYKTAIKFVGINYSNWAYITDNNFLSLLENFASKDAPTVIGQTLYNTQYYNLQYKINNTDVKFTLMVDYPVSVNSFKSTYDGTIVYHFINKDYVIYNETSLSLNAVDVNYTNTNSRLFYKTTDNMQLFTDNFANNYNQSLLYSDVVKNTYFKSWYDNNSNTAVVVKNQFSDGVINLQFTGGLDGAYKYSISDLNITPKSNVTISNYKIIANNYGAYAATKQVYISDGIFNIKPSATFKPGINYNISNGSTPDHILVNAIGNLVVGDQLISVDQDNQVSTFNIANLKSITTDTWAKHSTNLLGATLNDFCYINGVYIAVGQYGKIATSIDGNIWNNVNSGIGNTILCCYVQNGVIFCGCSADTQSNLLKSTDNGQTWNVVHPSFNTRNINSISGNGINQLVLVGDNGSIAYSTNNGTTFTLISTQAFSTSPINDIIFDGSKYIAVGGAGTTIVASSTNMINWSSNLNAVGYGANNIAFGLTNTNSIMYLMTTSNWLYRVSNDGIIWSSEYNIPEITTGQSVKLAYGNTYFVITGYANGNIDKTVILTQPNVYNINEYPTSADNTYTALNFLNNTWIRSGQL